MCIHGMNGWWAGVCCWCFPGEGSTPTPHTLLYKYKMSVRYEHRDLTDSELADLLSSLTLEMERRTPRVASAAPSRWREVHIARAGSSPAQRGGPPRRRVTEVTFDSPRPRGNCGAPNVSRPGWCSWPSHVCPFRDHAWHRMALGEVVDLTPCPRHPHKLAARCCRTARSRR